MFTQDIRNRFPLDESAVYLDHGGFGVVPKEIFDERIRIMREIERAPAPFFAFRYRPAWQEISRLVAGRFRVRPEQLALVDNVTDGVNAVLRSLSFAPGDEILATSSAYGAVVNAAAYIAGQQGARVVRAELQFPSPSPEQCVEAVKNAITPATRLAILDHATSATALILPIKEMTGVCRANGIPVLVDGAHAPGNIAVDIMDINADWYIANLHKWYFVPRACGFLWRSAERSEIQVPTVLSWDIDRPYPLSFEWTGTRDPSAWLSIPKAFAFMDGIGEAQVRRHNHALIRLGGALLAEAWQTGVNTPDGMIGSMMLMALPGAMPFPANEEGRRNFHETLWEKFKIVASPTLVREGRIWVRVSAQIYNNIEDYERLAAAVLDLCRR